MVLDVDSGIVVPSFMGKSLRSAVEYAQQSGLEINVMGSGIARQQSPLPGSHLLTGQKVTFASATSQARRAVLERPTWSKSTTRTAFLSAAIISGK